MEHWIDLLAKLTNQLSMKKLALLLTLFGFSASVARAQWVNQNAGFTNNTLGFYEFSIVDQANVWAICYDGVNGLGGPVPVLEFTRTTNGGTTWTPGKMGSDSSLAFSNIHALSATEAWVAMHMHDWSTGGGLFHTTDGGTTWTQSGVGTIFDSNSFPNFVYFKDPMNGIAGGDANNGYFEIQTTKDGGATWTRTPQAAVPAFLSGGNGGWFDGFDVVGDTVWFGNSRGQMYKSTDFGTTWTVSTVTTQPYTVYEIAFLDDGQHGVTHLRSNNGTVYLYSTSDGGATWTLLPSHPKWKRSRITAVPGTSIFVSTAVFLNAPARGSSYSTDYGATWVEIDQATPKAACRFLNATTGWAGGYFNDKPGVTTLSGGIYKWDSNSPLAIPLELTTVGENAQIYPNPVADRLHISLPGGSRTHSLAFYNAAGALVKEVAAKGAGAVDVSGLPVGLYFIRSKNEPGVRLRFVKQ